MPGPRKANSAKDRQLTAELKQVGRELQLPCGICGQPIDYDLPNEDPASFQRDHILSVKTHPHLEFEPSNQQPSHRRCNATKGARQQPRDVGTTTIAW